MAPHAGPPAARDWRGRRLVCHRAGCRGRSCRARESAGPPPRRCRRSESTRPCGWSRRGP
eukprot:2524053-Alexandrium_andersonii.AAC.1